MNIATTIFFAFLLSSFIEYCLHRFYLHHSCKQDHVKKHHKQFNSKTSFEIPGAKPKDIMSGYKYILVNIALYYVPSVLLFIDDQFMGVLFFVTALSYTLWVEYVHLHFHKPDGKKIENFWLFNIIKEKHKKHHIKYTVNYGIGSYVWDRLLKTEN